MSVFRRAGDFGFGERCLLPCEFFGDRWLEEADRMRRGAAPRHCRPSTDDDQFAIPALAQPFGDMHRRSAPRWRRVLGIEPDKRCDFVGEFERFVRNQGLAGARVSSISILVKVQVKRIRPSPQWEG